MDGSPQSAASRAALPLAGKRALVTGGGSGIGLACARALSGAGAAVTVLGRREAPLRAAVAAGAARDAIIADIAGPLPPLPPCDLLLHAAGAAESAPFLDSDEALWQRMLSVNLLGAAAVMRAVLPGMLAAGEGRIVAIASTAALKGYAYVTAYTAAKHGLLGLVRALAQEVAGRGVTVNAVCPGFAETPMTEASIARIVAKTGRGEAEARAALARHNPQGRLVQPEEVAAAALFLCLPGAAAVNGAAIPVAGGEV
ncbi:SDR family NAD(P)-dependent oxidoreductase [Roseicella aquatilis]|uniref:SDR family oxidoreductase n=1 Tax=Roseicella aquatilis TaxID=2527868 RepID=A0A4R4DEA9_9PROT|nr:SDR family oxidoreductase [Roseicella aquatilis]TCZ58695.1 SDR family oxidoreductase [Roseicella aquatilis]